MLDKLFEANLTRVFVGVAMRKLPDASGSLRGEIHLEATSLHVHGEYAEEEDQLAAIRLTHGYSRDHRPDLKQFVVHLMCAGGEGGVPLYFRVAPFLSVASTSGVCRAAQRLQSASRS